MKRSNFLQLILSALILVFPDTLFSSQGMSSPRISSRLAHSVCGQRLEFWASGVIQRPVKSAPLSNGNVGLPCGSLDWRLAPSHPDTFKTCDSVTERSNGRIVGGQEAKPHQFPFMVSVATGRQHLCGGSIINERWVLTAIHCRYSSAGYPDTVVAGDHNRFIDEGTEQVRRVAYWFDSPKKHNRSDLNNHDLALLKLKEPFNFNEYVQPIALPPPDYIPTGMVTIIGWGWTSPPNVSHAAALQFTEIPVIPLPKCQEQIKNVAPNVLKYVQESDICIGWEDGRANSCYGDSGGPMVTWIDGKVTLMGSTVGGAGGMNCSAPGYPNWYKRISFPWYLDYITKNTPV